MVAEREVDERLRAQAAQLDADLVEPVPAHARLEPFDVGQAVGAVGTRGAPDRALGLGPPDPLALLLLVARAAGDRERVVLGEPRHQLLEVVGREGYVGVYLDYDGERLRDRAGAAEEAVEVARAAAAVGQRL